MVRNSSPSTALPTVRPTAVRKGSGGSGTGVLRVALYDDYGGSSAKKGVLNVRGAADFELILRRRGYATSRVTASDIITGRLSGYDVLVHPGGEGVAQGCALQEEGLEQIRSFVRRGGGYVGVCAGANLASSDPNYGEHCLKLIATQTLDSTKEYPAVKYLRGHGFADMELTPLGMDVFKTDEPCVRRVEYANGPLITRLAKCEKTGLSTDFHILAHYTSDVASTKFGREAHQQGSRMAGKIAVAAAPYGSGRVLCFSPHPEKANGPHWMFRNAVRWVAGGVPNLDRIPLPRGIPVPASETGTADTMSLSPPTAPHPPLEILDGKRPSAKAVRTLCLQRRSLVADCLVSESSAPGRLKL